MAEIFGGPFRVYSTREFPGLEPSTDLTRVRPHAPQSVLLACSLSFPEFVQIRCPRHPQRCRAQI